MAMANKTKNVGIENEAKESKNSPLNMISILSISIILSPVPVAGDRFQGVRRKLQWGSQEESTESCRREAREVISTFRNE